MRQVLSEWLNGQRSRRKAGAQARLGGTLYERGDLTAAIDAYRQSLAHDPDRPLVLYNMGLALYKARRTAEAREAWTAALALAEGRNSYLEEQIQILLRQFG
jgi:tetratricopeptide (TPR) repeat protein